MSSSLKARVVGGLACSLIGVSALLLLGRPLAELSYDFSFLFKSTSVPEEVVMVYMDDTSHRQLEQPWFEAWDRSIHADLLDRLKEIGVRAVVFDILFDTTNNITSDTRLVQSMSSIGNVYVAGTMSPILLNGEQVGMNPTPPIDAIRSVTKWGLVEAAGADRVIRVQRRPQNRIQTLAWLAASELTTNEVANPESERWINYYGPPGTLPWLSYHQLFEPDSFDPSFLRDKVVFVGTAFGVGFTGGTGTDDFFTPFSKWTGRKSPGVEVVATVFLNLLRGESLYRMSALNEFGVTAILGLLLGFVISPLSPLRGVVFGCTTGLVLFVFIGGMTWSTQTWFPWVTVAGVQVPFVVAWCVITNTRKLQSEKQALQLKMAEYQAPSKPSTVQFSVTSPIAVVPGVSFVISVWAHLEEQRGEVLDRAEGSTNTEIIGLRNNKRRNPEEMNMDIQVDLPGITLSNNKDFISWTGEISRGCFLAMVPEGTRPGETSGVAKVFVDGMKIAGMPFSVNIGDVPKDGQKLVSEQSLRRKVFVSYSSKDRDAVLARVQGMEKAMPDLDVFMDVHSLRSGQDWEREILAAIGRSDIFYLFWSRNAAASKQVEMEWRHALSIKGVDFIQPIPLVSPDEVPPPAELATMHFNDWTLAFESGSAVSRQKK